jgi:hypothetical protein
MARTLHYKLLVVKSPSGWRGRRDVAASGVYPLKKDHVAQGFSPAPPAWRSPKGLRYI